MADLPLELLHAITKDVQHDPSIFNLRLVSKTLHSVATPLAFRVVVVNDSVKSAEAVSFLQGCDESVTSLHHLIGTHKDGTFGEAGREDKVSGQVGREALRAVFNSLAKFPNLENLRLDFHNAYDEDLDVGDDNIPENPSHFLLLQIELFAALAADPPPSLISLTLNNVIAIPHNIYAQENFHSVFRHLQNLDISVLSDVYYEGSHCQEPFVEFWSESVLDMIRSATTVSALTIRSDQPQPPLSLEDTFLPHLASLTLHQLELASVVDFVVLHKATLARLELHECSVNGGPDCEFPSPWHAFLTVFESELGALCNFVVENKEWDPDDCEVDRDPRFKYMREDIGFGYTHWEKEVPGEDQDLCSLESLMAVVKSRGDKDGFKTIEATSSG
ncbi:hypothetical protein B0H13DRAFT_1893635 [Mycena leptocephala]|nr:hypothetical protein B0H13DRAFT_1893635 [Mycena leptocephala]